MLPQWINPAEMLCLLCKYREAWDYLENAQKPGELFNEEVPENRITHAKRPGTAYWAICLSRQRTVRNCYTLQQSSVTICEANGPSAGKFLVLAIESQKLSITAWDEVFSMRCRDSCLNEIAFCVIMLRLTKNQDTSPYNTSGALSPFQREEKCATSNDIRQIF